MSSTSIQQGITEFIFGASPQRQRELLRFWEVLGFQPIEEGRLSAARSKALYGHASDLYSIRLKHQGCDTHGTGYVRLQFWSTLRNEGQGGIKPLVTGSRWMGMYCQDILQLRDAVTSESAVADWNLWVSPLVNAPLAKPAPEATFFEPFVGLRETLVFGDDFRLAFIQRGGFDRPGFGTYDAATPFRNTEGSHASLVQASGAFDTGFYKQAFGFETAPFGEAHDSGDEPPTRLALRLEDGQMFRVERTRAPEVPSGLLQVYSPHFASSDHRDQSRAGSRNLSLFSVMSNDLGDSARRAAQAGATNMTPVLEDEFSQPSLTFDAPDGFQWLVVSHVA